MSNQDN